MAYKLPLSPFGRCGLAGIGLHTDHQGVSGYG